MMTESQGASNMSVGVAQPKERTSFRKAFVTSTDTTFLVNGLAFLGGLHTERYKEALPYRGGV